MSRSRALVAMMIVLAAFLPPPARAFENPVEKVEFYMLRMDPKGSDATRFSR